MLHKTKWTLEKIRQRLQLIEPLVYRRQRPLPPFRYFPLDNAHSLPLVDTAVDDSAWAEIQPQTYWGRWETNFMLRTSFERPAEWEARQPLALYLPLGHAGDFAHPEALVYIDGAHYAACDRFHQEILLPEKWGNGRHQLALHGWTGRGGVFQTTPGTRLLMGQCCLVQIDQPTRDFLATVRVTLGVVTLLNNAHNAAYGTLLDGLDEAFRALDTREPFTDAFYDSVPQAHGVLNQAIQAAGAPLPVEIVAAGHAHIDVAWLWTLAQTRRKAGRTFQNVLRLMEQFPDYRFTQSQPQLYEFVRQDYPELFEAIKAKVREGRWEPTGAMWVEADCNLTGAESLARQFILGRHFFREHFGMGAASPILWLPDVFGYAWNLPQLAHQANLKYFFTIKIGWSQYNRMPYESFWWQGLDGTRILTHFSPTPESGAAHAGTYNAEATPKDVMGTWHNFQQGEQSRLMLMAFGYGDGGGGPTREMLENIREMRQFPATPQVQHGTALSFFERLEAEADERGKPLPVWKGELYLEYHRGTYTSQGRIKRANRKCEFLLHDAEFLATYANQVNDDYTYPHAELREAWQIICLNQFHDIIPGSSIQEVYIDALEQYDAVFALATAVRNQALAAIAAVVGGDLLIINPTSFERDDPALWLHGEAAAGQPVTNGLLIQPKLLPPYSITRLHADRSLSEPAAGTLTVTPTLLENNLLRVELDANGDITRIYDKRYQREVLPPGAVANQFQAFEDRPLNWDAWDIDIYYEQENRWLAEPAQRVEVVEEGPLRATLAITRRILHSDFTQYISLRHNSARLDFNTTINWHERHILLKVAFPVNIFTTQATYDIQWGNVERPTHRNTSWDWARFETVGHKWVDVSEGDYGVSLLNDCKYGHDVQDSTPAGCTLRLSLLRSPTMPDPRADEGEHEFVYSLLPHGGPWSVETQREAYALNDPLLLHVPEDTAVHPSELINKPFVAVDRPNVIIETVKQAEDGEGVVVRLYESMRRRGPVTLTANFPFTEVWRANVLEDKQERLVGNGRHVTFTINPYEIVTIRLV